MNRRSLLGGGLAALSSVSADAYSDPPTPKGTCAIIDLSHSNAIDLQAVKNAGVVAVIHKATEGVHSVDCCYHYRRAEAKKLGLLWGSYHFSNTNDGCLQAINYLSHAEVEDDDLMCLDFEDNKGDEMTLPQAHDFITAVYEACGRYPVIYGGSWLRSQVRNKPDALLSKCPLWYRRYGRRYPVQIPSAIWSTFTLWQYSGEAPNTIGLPDKVDGRRFDRSLFQGSDDQLRAAWPFTRRAPGAVIPRGRCTVDWNAPHEKGQCL